MDEKAAAVRKVYEYELLEGETKVKFYRRLLGKPLVEDIDKYAKENTHLLQRVAQQKSENEVLHRKVDDLASKLCKAHRECAELRNELKATKEELLEDASDCLVGSVIGIKHEPNDLEPDEMFYFLRITKDEAYRIDMGGYAHLEVWED